MSGRHANRMSEPCDEIRTRSSPASARDRLRRIERQRLAVDARVQRVAAPSCSVARSRPGRSTLAMEQRELVTSSRLKPAVAARSLSLQLVGRPTRRSWPANCARMEDAGLYSCGGGCANVVHGSGAGGAADGPRGRRQRHEARTADPRGGQRRRDRRPSAIIVATMAADLNSKAARITMR